MRKRIFVVIASLIVLAAHSWPCFAQSLRGTVTDAVTQRPLAGALVQLLDANGGVVDRELTDAAGEYFIPAPSQARRLRVQRLGFRATEFPIRSQRPDSSRLDVALVVLPTMLQPIPVRASACSPRADRASAMSFYEHARAGLLAMVAARESKTGNLVVVRYQRTLAEKGERVLEQSVVIDSTRRAAVSFTAALSATDFLRTGFMQDGPTGRTFLAPDPDVLLDEAFVRGYCFHIAQASPNRPNQIGLGFVPSDRRSDRVDVAGTLWVDTLRRALRDVEFSYLGLGREVERLKPGGMIALDEMPNGLVIITRWHLRLVGTVEDTVTEKAGLAERNVVTTKYYPSVVGGEVTRARWADGTTWLASLGRFVGRAVTRDGRPLANLDVRLEHTPYRQQTDGAGMFEFLELLPGPYEIVVVDSALQSLNLTIPANVTFVAVRDSTLRTTITIPTAADFVRDRCRVHRMRSDPRAALLLARVVGAHNQPIAGVKWSLRKRIGSQLSNTVLITSGGETGQDGLLQVCSNKLRPGDTVLIDVRRGRDLPIRTLRRLGSGLTVVKIAIE